MALPSDFNYGSWEGTPLTAADYSPQMLAEIERLQAAFPEKKAFYSERGMDVPMSWNPEAYAQYIGSIVRRDRARGYDINASGLSTTRPSSVTRPSAGKSALVSGLAILGGGMAYGASGAGAGARSEERRVGKV